MDQVIPSRLLLDYVGWHPAISSVALVGGTQGDEMTGLTLLKEWDRNLELVERPGIKLTRLLANPEAAGKCVHYINEDLNDCFSAKSLESSSKGSYERERAKEILSELGGRKGHTDLIVDFHNTTANMGITLIVSRLNPFITRLCATIATNHPKEVRLYYTPEEQYSSNFLDSLGASGLTVEVGPQKHGPYLDKVLYEKVRSIASEVMDFCAVWNTGSAPSDKVQLPVYQFMSDVTYEDFNKDEVPEEDLNPYLIGRDFLPIDPGTKLLSRGTGYPKVWEGPGTAYPVFVGEEAYRKLKEGEVAMQLAKRTLQLW